MHTLYLAELIHVVSLSTTTTFLCLFWSLNIFDYFQILPVFAIVTQCSFGVL